MTVAEASRTGAPQEGLPPRTLAEIVARAGDTSYRRWQEQATRCGYCARPVRLKGRVLHDGVEVYNTAAEPDRVLLKRCGNRRASVCPSCSFEYAGDMWQLLYTGLAGGRKGLPDTIAGHPMIFATLTPPSFGPVHSLRERNGRPHRCRARRDHPLCRHGRPGWCMTTHHPKDAQLGQPLCPECYDYPAAVLFNWWAPELWRRFTIDLRRVLAGQLELTEHDFNRLVRISYAKVAEFQRRGVVHFHAIIRLDAPGDDWQPPSVYIPTEALQTAVETAASRVRLVVDSEGGEALVLRWGTETDVQPITQKQPVEGELTPNKVAAYISKYACKGTEDFGIGDRPLDAATARDRGLPEHIVRMIDTANRLAASVDGLQRVSRWTHMAGFRGHFHTKSRRYSTTLAALRKVRADYRRRQDVQRRGLPVRDPGQDGDEENTTLTVGEWRFVGIGYTTSGDAALAAASAAYAREWRHLAREAAA